MDVTTADATGGRSRVESGKEDPAILGARLGKTQGLPRFSPRRVKSLLPAFCIDMRVDHRDAASSWRVAPLESLGDVYDGVERALRLPRVRFI